MNSIVSVYETIWVNDLRKALPEHYKVDRNPRTCLPTPVICIAMGIGTVTVIAAFVVAITVRAVTVIAAAVVVPIAPVGSVIHITWVVSVVKRDWDGESKAKANTGHCRRFRKERQSSNRQHEDNELLHII